MSRAEMKQKANLSEEATEFFADAPRDRRERRAFQKASLASLTADSRQRTHILEREKSKVKLRSVLIRG